MINEYVSFLHAERKEKKRKEKKRKEEIASFDSLSFKEQMRKIFAWKGGFISKEWMKFLDI